VSGLSAVSAAMLTVSVRFAVGRVENRRLALELEAVVRLMLKALLVVLPLLSASVFATLLALDSSVLAASLSFFVAVLFFKHGTVSLIFCLLALFCLALALLTLSSFSIFGGAATLFLLASLLVSQVGSESLSLAPTTYIRVCIRVIILLLVLDDVLSLLHSMLLLLAPVVFLLALLILVLFAGFFRFTTLLNSSLLVVLALLAVDFIGLLVLLLEVAHVLFVSLASLLGLALSVVLVVAGHVVGALGEFLLLLLVLLAPLFFLLLQSTLLWSKMAELLLELLGTCGLLALSLGIHEAVLATRRFAANHISDTLLRRVRLRNIIDRVMVLGVHNRSGVVLNRLVLALDRNEVWADIV
jgi:hypothetical protein